MKFLVTIPRDKVNDNIWTTRREPAVPCFPSQHGRAFLGIPEFRLADKAEVLDIDTDPDVLVDALAKEYPGLPRRLHENYVLGVFKAVFDTPIGTVFRIIVNQKQALLIKDETNHIISLWDEQPL